MGKRIHIIDDDPVVRNLLGITLSKRGFDVSSSETAHQVFDMTDNFPDLFILDVVMPGLNGFEVCKWIKGVNRATQVILLSATPGLKALASDSGADEYVEKPFETDALVARIHQCFINRATQELFYDSSL